MNILKRVLAILMLSAVIFGCSRKKNTFISRNYHAVTSEYNALYNGQVALDMGQREIAQNYADNYWDLLPVERLAIDDKILLPDSVRNQNFGRAEEKAVKAIQKHSMQIGGKERNPQMDEAYLLLGKARYFDQRFVPALDAFNYILYRYPASDNITHARIWREKTNIRLGNEKLAIKNLKKILDSDRLEDQDIADANASLSQAYMNLNQLDSALVPLQTAASYTRENEEKGRYLFITGQLYNRLGQKELANQAFDKVIDLNRKSPRIYYVNSYIKKAQNFNYNQGDNAYLLNMLRELEGNRENRPYLDKIYFQLGEYYNRIDSTRLAEEFYNKSLRSPSSDVYLKSVNYEVLANINFDRANYQMAGKYYDSTLTSMSPELLEYRTIKKKRENLDDVIKYELIAEETDSILNLAALSEEERLAYFTKYTDELRAKALEQADSAELPVYAANVGNSNTFPSAATTPAAGPNTGGTSNSFYFYNPLRVSRGAQEFLRTWGSRELTDNWRWGGSTTGPSTVNAQERIMEVNFDNNPIYDPATYIAQFPSDRLILDSLATQRNLANYQLGIIYNEKFGEQGLAAKRLEFLLKNEPGENLAIPAKYNLYRIYETMGQQQRAQELKTDILTNYPDSRYAAFINDPSSIQADENSPEALYNRLFFQFEEGNFEEVIEKSSEYSRQFTGNRMLPKFELLKAQAMGRLYGLQAYKESLNYVAMNYSQTPEGQRAQQILNSTIPELENLEFNRDDLQANYKLVFSFDHAEQEKGQQFREKLAEVLQELGYDELSISRERYDSNTDFVTVHGLYNRSKALGFQELLQKNKEYKIERQGFVISAENYRIVILKKNLRNFLDQD
ncbi:MAG: hypothetical protein VX712_04430 [Bacteroidota bacterium]|nr:hypothetical protein [Bacteroidota bacterium]